MLQVAVHGMSEPASTAAIVCLGLLADSIHYYIVRCVGTLPDWRAVGIVPELTIHNYLTGTCCVELVHFLRQRRIRDGITI